jgi:putative ABC transport system permease protein
MTADEFSSSIREWTTRETGLVQVLGSVIGLGVLVGMLVVGQTFYMFAVENQRYFAALKALGAQNSVVLRMIAAQAILVAGLGYGLGLGAATAILAISDNDLSPMRGLGLSPIVAVVAAAVVPIVVLITAAFGAKRALTAEPGLVFRA